MLFLITRMEKENTEKLLDRMFELEIKIEFWGSTNSQSNPGAVMDLRALKKELDKIKKQLGFK